MLPRSLLIVIVVAAVASWAWRAHVEEADGERLAALVQAGDIRMISSETCGWCTAARRWMTEQGLPFEECFIEREARCLSDYEALGSQGTPTLVVRGQPIIGFDREAIAQALAAPRAPGG